MRADIAWLMRLPRHMGPEPSDLKGSEREQRLRALVAELLPQLRRLHPTMPDDQLREMAEAMARLRLLGEDIAR